MPQFILYYLFTALNLSVYCYILFATGKRISYSKAHRSFFVLMIFVFIWIIIRTLENTFESQWELLINLDFAFAALVSGALVIFALHYPRENKNISLLKELIIYFPVFLLAILSFFSFFYKIYSYRVIEYSYNYVIFISILIIYFVGIGGFLFIKKLLKSSGIEKVQLKYISIGYLASISILLFDSIYTASKGAHSEEWDFIFFNSSIVFAILIAYAMLRYRFMDIRVVIKKGLIYGISLIVALAVYTYIALTLKSTIEESWNIHPTWTAAILIALVALGFPPLKKLVEKSINTLFKGRKSIDLAVKEVREKVVHETDFEKLVRMVSEEVEKFLEVDEVRLYLLDHQEKKYIYENDGIKESIEIGNDLVRYFDKYSDALVRDEVSHLMEEREGKFEKERMQKAEKELKKRKKSLAMPFKTEEEVFGLLMLGERKKGQAYTIQDVKYLESLREQVGFTLANALLYKEAMARIQAGMV